MNSLLYILPLLLFLICLGFLFIDIKSPKGWIGATAIALISLIVLVSQLYLSHQLGEDHNQLLAKIDDQELFLKQNIAKQLLLAQQAKVDPDATSNFLQKATHAGMSLQNPLFQHMSTANQALIELLENNIDVRIKTNVEVYRIPEEINQPLITQLLESRGYKAYYHNMFGDSNSKNNDEENKAKDEEETDSEDIKISLNFERQSKFLPPLERPKLARANLLNVGSRVKPYDVKVIALTLMRAGVNLKSIKPFRKKTKRNSLIVEFAWKKHLSSKPLLTAEKVINKTSFKR